MLTNNSVQCPTLRSKYNLFKILSSIPQNHLKPISMFHVIQWVLLFNAYIPFQINLFWSSFSVTEKLQR